MNVGSHWYIMKKIINHLKENWIRHGFETLVVTVGILGAYSLNQWNTSLSEEKLLNHYVSSMIQDLEEQKLIIDKQLEYENRKIGISNYLWATIVADNIENQVDTIHLLLGELIGKRTFNMVRVTYNDMVSSGNLKLFNNDDRRTAITYYEALSKVNQIINDNNINIVFKVNAELAFSPIYAYNIENKRILIEQLSDFKAKVKFENAVGTLIKVANAHLNHIERMRNETNNLIAELKK